MTPSRAKVRFSPEDTLALARGKLATALAAAGKEPSALEARLLLEATTGLTSLSLATGADQPLGQDAAERLSALASRRLAGEPVSRIIGKSGFFGLDLLVAPEVLDPRADTETLVTAALSLLGSKCADQPRILDLGVGSGAILCALLVALPDAIGIGVDISPAACALAHINLHRSGLDERSLVIRGDWTESLQGRFDLIVSNPPYISAAEILTLDDEVLGFDPLLALDGGIDGLAAYRRIANALPRLLQPGGFALFEIGWRQAFDVTTILSATGLGPTKTFRDHRHNERVIALSFI